MTDAWRTVLEQLEPVQPEAEPMGGDVGLLVPIQPSWRVLEASAGFGARGAVLSYWCEEVVSAVADPSYAPVLEARAAAESPLSTFRGVVAGQELPVAPGSRDLVVLEGETPWSIEQVRVCLRPGGWLVWLVEGAPHPALNLRSPARAMRAASEVARWGIGRLAAPTRWRNRLEMAGYRMCRMYIHVREYTWGYLPFDAPAVHQYYLTAIQEEAQGEGRGRARLARWAGRLGVYPYLVSTYALVARVGGGGAP